VSTLSRFTSTLYTDSAQWRVTGQPASPITRRIASFSASMSATRRWCPDSRAIRPSSYEHGGWPPPQCSVNGLQLPFRHALRR
jgi:hypothetical protein